MHPVHFNQTQAKTNWKTRKAGNKFLSAAAAEIEWQHWHFIYFPLSAFSLSGLFSPLRPHRSVEVIYIACIPVREPRFPFIIV